MRQAIHLACLDAVRVSSVGARPGLAQAFLNARGTEVIFGVAYDSAVFDQAVSDRSHREIAAMPDRSESPAVVLRVAHRPRDNRPGGAA